MASSNSIDSTTQKFLDIHDVTNDLVILKDGTTSIILTVDAMNFGLLAEEEQDSIMYAYAGLLNSLNYPIQIIIRSQTKDVTGYLNLLKDQEDTAINRVQQRRIMKYREFVANLIRERNVLDKKFYISIPAKPLELGLVPVSSVLPGQGSTDVSTVDKSMLIDKARNILEPKRDHLIAQFARIGLYSRQLETQEIIQLFYQSYNPEAFEGQSMDDSKSYTAPLVSASIEGSAMNMQDPNQTAQQPQATEPAQTATPASAATPAIMSTPTPTPEPTQSTPAPAVTQAATTTGMGTTPTETPVTTPADGYTPTQMPAANTPTLATTPAATPAMDAMSTTPPAGETPAAPSEAAGTPLPPAPELPKTSPGEADPAVPKETEIEIQKPGTEMGGTPADPAVTQSTSTTPVEPAATPPVADTTATGQNGEMTPLPEIK